MSEIFVFGSNLAGRHGAGAAKYALNHHGAIYGVAIGPQGDSYGIPTLDGNFQQLQLANIQVFVINFILYAMQNPDKVFTVTRIGCGLAGFENHEIAPMFANVPANCLMPTEWRTYLPEGTNFHDLH